MSAPEVSVIMSVYNGEKYLSQSIESILRQTFKDFEFIIVDDASTDNSHMIMQEYARADNRVKVIRNPSNLGLAQSLNMGLNNSIGTFIARMDADDIAVENRLEMQLRYLKENPGIVLTGSSMYLIDLRNNIVSRFNAISDPEILRKILYYQNLTSHPTWMFRREILKDIKGYRDLPAAQDYDFLMRLCFLNYKTSNIETPLLYYRIHDKSISYEKNLIQTKISYYLRKCYKKGLILDDGLIKDWQVAKQINTSRPFRLIHNFSLRLSKFNDSLRKNRFIVKIMVLCIAILLSPYTAYNVYCWIRLKLLLLRGLRTSTESN